MRAMEMHQNAFLLFFVNSFYLFFPPFFFQSVFGGVFADQKICKPCPHKYTRYEDFTVLCVNVRNNRNLQEALEQ